jgi:sugar phosphate isomerase/epimerase
MPWGSTIHAEIERRTSVDFELDVYWLFNAGLDPVTVMKKLKDRLTLVHLKDGLPGGVGKTLGKGQVPVAEVVDLACALDIPMIVESETLAPDGPTEARECIQYLKSL